jgi:hypothetical protein
LITGFPENAYPRYSSAPKSTNKSLAPYCKTSGLWVIIQPSLSNGDRPISKVEAQALADYFHVNASLFT